MVLCKETPMKQTLFALLTVVAISGLATAAKSLQVKDLPAAVQKTVQDTLKGGEIKNISKEVEKGVTQYEVESMLNGKHRAGIPLLRIAASNTRCFSGVFRAAGCAWF